MNVNFNKNGSASTINLENLSRDEVATIWYALNEYKENLLNTINKPNATVEDEAFCYAHAAECSQLQFDMLENHEAHLRRVIKAWADIV